MTRYVYLQVVMIHIVYQSNRTVSVVCLTNLQADHNYFSCTKPGHQIFTLKAYISALKSRMTMWKMSLINFFRNFICKCVITITSGGSRFCNKGMGRGSGNRPTPSQGASEGVWGRQHIFWDNFSSRTKPRPEFARPRRDNLAMPNDHNAEWPR